MAMKLGPLPVSRLRGEGLPDRRHELPLIVISHGRTGSFVGHRDTAKALADAGFVVAAISHPGDNAQGSGHTDELSVFVERPADIKRLVDDFSARGAGPERGGSKRA